MTDPVAPRSKKSAEWVMSYMHADSRASSKEGMPLPEVLEIFIVEYSSKASAQREESEVLRRTLASSSFQIMPNSG